MSEYYELEKRLMKEITGEKGFSFKKLVKIIELNSILGSINQTNRM